MKRNYWPVFFIGLFSFTFSMIVWTVVNASKANIDEDKSFLKKYQEVDEKFNDMMSSNKKFSKKYDLEFYVNDKMFTLTTKDIMYSQRVLEKFSKHKNLLNMGDNKLELFIINKNTQEKQKINITLKITKSSDNGSDIILKNSNFKNTNNQYKTTFNINESNNWNITGSFEVDGKIGYIYIKTNAA